MLIGTLLGCTEDARWQQRSFTVRPHEATTFNYRADHGEVFSFAVDHGPEMPDGEVGLNFGWEKQRVFCSGRNCAQASGWLLFCPVHGSITAELNNLSDSDFGVTVRRVPCEGADRGTVRCPAPSTLRAMCGGK